MVAVRISRVLLANIIVAAANGEVELFPHRHLRQEVGEP